MSFQFQFERILTMKEKETESALNEMNMFKRMKETAENQLLELVEKKDSYMNDYQNMMRNSIRVTEIQEREQYLLFLNKQIEKGRKKVLEITKEFNVKNRMLVAKNQEEKVWSTWRERSLEEYTEKLNKEEQNSLDEMAVIRYFRNKN
ncbi:flagellar export protein FliJ [Neobacillus soli]|uniref:flagellar export protein FliJ n=1 Tax=Neobacillus soli TaxID=220688 RepID=UPI000826089B|nr:flagellar export protein FliJ [Neobacillus soli]